MVSPAPHGRDAASFVDVGVRCPIHPCLCLGRALPIKYSCIIRTCTTRLEHYFFVTCWELVQAPCCTVYITICVGRFFRSSFQLFNNILVSNWLLCTRERSTAVWWTRMGVSALRPSQPKVLKHDVIFGSRGLLESRKNKRYFFTYLWKGV